MFALAKKIHNHRRIAITVAVAIPICLVILMSVLWFSLPSVDNLHTRANVSSTRINDRYGKLLYEIIDPRIGHHTPLALNVLPPHLLQATVAVEDANFFTNPGVDIVGILRAVWINLRGGDVLAGGSTITQQLARQLLLSPDERNQRTVLRKIRESLLAWRITQRYSKEDILALYLNEVYYGNLAYGVDAAARTYFGKPVSQLDLAECAMLAGLPQSPVTYDPFMVPDLVKQRQMVVLGLMVRQGMITEGDAAIASQEKLSYAPATFPIRAPHFVSYVRHWLEEQFGTEEVIRGGLVVTTTLDLALNESAEEIIKDRLGQLASPVDNQPSHNTNNAALVALETHTGAILTMVGSPDYFNAKISGAVNAAVVLRQPGSAIKPITYAAAFSHVAGFTAATPIMDVRTAFPTREGLPYIPENYDGQHHGPISVRAALATSNNVAAVTVLQQVGLDQMLSLANSMGIRSLKTSDSYGLALTLGGGEVRLLELTSAYGVFANEGERVDPYGVSQVADANGTVLYTHPLGEAPTVVVDPRIAWLVTDILSDNSARAAAFGLNSVLRLTRPAAVKTGTTTDWRDNWTVGYTPDVVAGVWTGNADNEAMVNISGVTGAGPIWHDYMEIATRGKPSHAFPRPDGLVQVRVCALSGMLPVPECAQTREEWFISGTEPTTTDQWYKAVLIDSATGNIATDSTPRERIVQKVGLDLPAPVRDWAKSQGWLLVDAQAGLHQPSQNTANSECGHTGQVVCSAVLLQPDSGSLYRIVSTLPLDIQRIPLQVRVDDARVVRTEVIQDGTVVIASFRDHSYSGYWKLQAGDHFFIVRVYYGDDSHVDSTPVSIHVEQ